MTAPRFSVIVPHYNQPEALRLCLKSLMGQTTSKGAFEVIVGDNGGIADKAALCALGPNIRIVQEQKRGAAHARNAAIRVARGEIFAFTDADCIAAPDWLEEGAAALKGADYVGGAIAVTVADEAALTPVEAFERIFGFRQKMYVTRQNFAATANLFVRRSAVEAIGPFRAQLSEDMDWGRRAAALGLRSDFNAKPIVNHPARSTWNALVSKWDRMIRERWNGFVERHSCAVCARMHWFVMALATALSWAPHLWVVATSSALQRPKDRLAAANTLVRIRLWRAQAMIRIMFSAKAISLTGGINKREEVQYAPE